MQVNELAEILGHLGWMPDEEVQRRHDLIAGMRHIMTFPVSPESCLKDAGCPDLCSQEAQSQILCGPHCVDLLVVLLLLTSKGLGDAAGTLHEGALVRCAA